MREPKVKKTNLKFNEDSQTLLTMDKQVLDEDKSTEVDADGVME